MFNVGDRVTWSSQAGGSTTEKTGEIVVVVPAGKWLEDEMPLSVLEEHTLAMDLRSPPRNHKSYVVSVEAGPKAWRRLYHPRVSHLMPANRYTYLKKVYYHILRNLRLQFSHSPTEHSFVYRIWHNNVCPFGHAFVVRGLPCRVEAFAPNDPQAGTIEEMNREIQAIELDE